MLRVFDSSHLRRFNMLHLSHEWRRTHLQLPDVSLSLLDELQVLLGDGHLLLSAHLAPVLLATHRDQRRQYSDTHASLDVDIIDNLATDPDP